MNAQPKQSKLALIMILVVFAAFFVVGRFVIDPTSLPRLNHGTLLIPHLHVDTLDWRDTDGMPYTADDMSGQWSMLYVADGSCDSACKNGLYYLIRQLRLSLDRDINRVRRIVLHTAEANEELRAFLDDNVAGMLELHGDADRLNAALTEIPDHPENAQGKIFLVSPDGMIFIWYPSHADMENTLEEADRIRADLKRTLKGSLIG